MHDTISPGQRFVSLVNRVRSAVSRAAERRAERGVHIAEAIHLLRGDMMVCARAVMAAQVANRLAALCEYMCARLTYAEVEGVDAPFSEVGRLLDDLRRASPSFDLTRSASPAATAESTGSLS